MELEGFAEPGSQEAELLKKVDRKRLPKHVAVIMDGNGRWAGIRKLPRVAGHRAGIESVREIVESSSRLGLEVLTLYAFSVENWKRPRGEVRTLMKLLKEYIRLELDSVHKNNIRFLAIGRIQELDESVRAELQNAVDTTKGNTGMLLSVALNYSGRAEIVDTFSRLLREYKQNGRKPEVTEEMISRSLYTSGIPDPDLLIRTSGEMRVSNFLLWQIAYSEIYITPTFWPDFRRKHLLEAILEYQQRDRRYGGI
ncbi:MAG: uppS [Acidobacteria bacterium]|jgi:undecaprenyl diphosphate synthase|nr:uppS [Acidobacteriota bacterium]